MQKLVRQTAVAGLALAVALGLWASLASANLGLFYSAQNAALSIDGAVFSDGCTTNAACNQLQSSVPVGATVDKAFLYVADVAGSNPTPTGSVSLAGNVLDLNTFTKLTPDANFANTYRRDVTSIMKPIIEGTGGLQTHQYSESPFMDGAVLVVVYKHASTSGGTAIILDGELAQGGDSTTLTFGSPYASGDVIMSLASSYSFGDGQFTNVDIVTSSHASRRLSHCAGGNDDGSFINANGTLITAGGVGDSTGNPGPTCNGDNADDELYNLAQGDAADANPFLTAGDTFVTFNTDNPSSDDNVFALFFTSSIQVTEVDDTQIPTDDGGGPIATPAPASLLILGAGLLVGAIARRRRA